ncbi:lipoprotein NlpI [Thalassotalea maritima]|uniref:lipoprotein NlpI n=1 Tax=Thalassotalea maritima TaxID=3242416 RepID=UPI0035294CC4
MKLLRLFPIAIFAVAIQGCNNTPDSSLTQPASSQAQVLITKPRLVSAQSELAIARLTEILTRAEITEEQRAKLMYDRGVVYDSVGLRSLAHYDFQRALKLQPDLVDGYNFLGINFTQRQQFLQAYDAFDTAIELDPDHDYAYLNRGIALYYGRRPEQALADLQRFQLDEQQDPYRIAWLYLVERDIDPVKAKQSLREHFKQLQHDNWANNILALLLEDINQQQFLSTISVGVSDHNQLLDRLCEAYFYLGKYHQYQGNIETSQDYFRLALTTNVYEFVEYRFAELELALHEKEMTP